MSSAPSCDSGNRPDLVCEPLSAARRAFDWTTRLLLCGIIAAVGLGFGRQVLQWWSVGEPASDAPAFSEVSTHPPAGHGDDGPRDFVAFAAGPWRLLRETVEGSVDQATAVLVRRAAEITAEAVLPKKPPDSAEQVLLERASSIPWADDAPHGDCWRVAAISVGVPTVIGLKWPPGVLGQRPANLAQTDARVVTWGIAVPAGESQWAVYCIIPEQTITSSRFAPDIPLPPGTRRTLEVGIGKGGYIIGLEGETDLAVCRRFYERWFVDHQWVNVVARQTASDGWFARYEHRKEGETSVVDIRLGLDARRRLEGIIVCTQR